MRKELERIREAIGRGAYPDEAAISNGVVLRVLNLLDWPAFDTDVVWPQYQAGDGRVDFALCHPPKKPAVLVEVKRLGAAEAGERLCQGCAGGHIRGVVVEGPHIRRAYGGTAETRPEAALHRSAS